VTKNFSDDEGFQQRTNTENGNGNPK